MNRKNRETYEMLTSVVDFANRNVSGFPKISSDVFEELESQVKAAGTESAATIAAETEVLVTRDARNAAFESLKTDLSRVAQLASALGNNKLRMPARARTHDLIATGQAFLEAAASMKEELAAHRFPENFAEAVGAKVDELSRTENDYRDARRRRSLSYEKCGVLLGKAVATLKRFDVVIENALEGDDAALSLYSRARTIHRTPAKKEVINGKSPAVDETPNVPPAAATATAA